ncbi:MAG: response regulator receiver modulated sensor-containing diguanylate [Bradyrhizobium sp.]|nr:response regulator receiver modulated sensor-containing diguanylate [Bradyrhizobium sp.]
MNTPVKVLLVEDSEDDAKLALRALKRGGFEPASTRVQTAADLRTALSREHWDAVISDFSMPGFTGLEALAIVRSVELDIPFILISGAMGEDTAVAAMKAGASDYMMKQSLARLAPALERELREAQIRIDHRRAQQNLVESEERFRGLTALSSDWYWEQDAELRFTRISFGLGAPFSGDSASWIGKRRWELSYRDMDWTTHRALLAARQPFRDFEVRPVNLLGGVTYASISGEPRFDAAGLFIGYRGVGRDITQSKLAAQLLRESDRRFSVLLQNVQLASVMLDREARITYCNEYLLRLTGWTLDEVIGRDWFETFMPPELGDMRPVFQALLKDLPEAWHRENEIYTRTRQRRMISWSNSVLRSAAGEVTGVASIGEDITERKAAEDRVVHLNRVYATLSGINTLIVRASNHDELFRGACQVAITQGGFNMAWIGIIDPPAGRLVLTACAEMHGDILEGLKALFISPRGALDGQTMAARAIRECKAIVTNDLTNAAVVFGSRHMAAGTHSMAILPLIIGDRSVGVLSLYASKTEFFDEEGLKLLTELAGDIAFAIDHIDKQGRLDYLAYYDALTGLANRSLFLERLAQHIRTAAGAGYKLALYLIDLERFKNINDSLGRLAGDALLRQVADWLTQSVGDASLLARIGADHFAVVLPKILKDSDVTWFLENSIAAFLEHPFHLGEAELRVAAKGGIAVFPEDGADADALFRNAEAALKKAKASGDRYLFYTEKMTATVAGKLTLENQLRQALEREEFVLHYQPKVNLASGRLTSAEALIRWNDPRTGLVPPGRFIPILEETGLITEVGRWALRHALADYLRWRAAGLAAVRIAVNVSPMQLRNREFVAEVRQAVGIDPQAAAGLELEITESLIMEDVDHNIACLREIREMGVTIAIDDFGTGFSSLSYLSRLPVDTLKIDRSFVVGMTSPEGMALVSTIIGLAHAFKLKVVAEGVEIEEQSRLLRLLQCDEMQGFLFSKPLPVALFESRYLHKLHPA